jgi:hypothetical protein
MRRTHTPGASNGVWRRQTPLGGGGGGDGDGDGDEAHTHMHGTSNVVWRRQTPLGAGGGGSGGGGGGDGDEVHTHTHTHGTSNGVWRRQTPLDAPCVLIMLQYTSLYTVYEPPLVLISIRTSVYTNLHVYEPPLHPSRHKHSSILFAMKTVLLLVISELVP